MTPFRQTILPGETGSDVTAVKHAYVRMGVAGAGALADTNRAGPAFVTVTKTVQRQHRLKVDGIYGEQTHAIVAPHFNARDVVLYRAAKIRDRPPPPPPAGDAQALAKKLLVHHLQATAAGKAVWSQGGYWVHIDPRPLRLMCWLIEEEAHKIGTFAICSDHHDDGPHGHAGGFAFDLSSIDGVSVAATSAKARSLTLAVATQIMKAPELVHPRQLICGGYGNHRDSAISACSLPGADGYYGATVMQEHTNHLHSGF